MKQDPGISRRLYAGLFAVTLATLMYEILLTRIFSVTMWYHFAFVAVSVAIFGMTVGAVIVYLAPHYFTEERTKKHLALSSLLFGITTVFSFLSHLSIPFDPGVSIKSAPVVWLFSITLTYAVLSVPFILSGITVCLALTRFSKCVSKLYAADLAGAAVGCIAVVVALIWVDGPTAVIVTAVIACLGAVLFAADAGELRLRRRALAWCLGLALISCCLLFFYQRQHSLLRPMWVKGVVESPGVYEKWNSFSRIYVDGDPTTPRPPFGWGLSSKCPPNIAINQLLLNIDASAGTVLTEYDGNPAALGYLKYDVTNIAHFIRPNADVLVIGAGGGRDILSALVFEQKSVTGIELNGDTLSALNERFGDFTGHLDRDPKVEFVNDEARSYIARSSRKYDIMQVSLIDTWAATAAGAFVLSENSLYTVEAWKLFLQRLKPNGVLTFSRWYFEGSPGVLYRLTSLASQSLIELGIQKPREHMLIVLHRLPSHGPGSPDGVGTMLVSAEPLSTADVAGIERVARSMDFEVVLSPNAALDTVFETIAEGDDLKAFTGSYPINIAPTTDDSPFFFNMLRLRDAFRPDTWAGGLPFNTVAVTVLGALLLIVTVLTLLAIVVPLVCTTNRSALKGSFSLFVFFVSIGLAFMLVEISQMQRLVVFLGHPTYGLTVVLFSLLISSGVGSMLTDRIAGADKPRAMIVFGALVLVLAAFGWLTPVVADACQSMSTAARILVSVGMIFPIGILMGTAFPMGMKLAAGRASGLMPWLWGMNGATSVLASVLAVVIALTWSISTAFWTGLGFYVVATLSYAATRRVKQA